MKRRQFIKSAAATTLAPMVPGSIASGMPVSALQYAKAVEVANKWAYTTAHYLKIALKVDDAASEAVLKQLQLDGIIGPKGSSGLCLAKRMSVLKSSGLAKGAAKLAQPSDTVQKTAKKILLEDDPIDAPEEEPDETAKLP